MTEAVLPGKYSRPTDHCSSDLRELKESTEIQKLIYTSVEWGDLGRKACEFVNFWDPLTQNLVFYTLPRRYLDKSSGKYGLSLSKFSVTKHLNVFFIRG